MRTRVAIVLPPREAFSPGAAGALGLLARRHASWDGRFDATVYGPPPPTPPFTGVKFVPVSVRGWFGPSVGAYARGLVRALRADPPALIEVHNRPDVALSLARRLPHVPVTLILNNDPQGMRRAKSPRERDTLLAVLAGIACCSAYLAERLTDANASPARTPIVLPNCLDLAEVPSPAAVRDPVVLFAGRVVADKGADAFVRACAKALPDLPGWSAEMVGGDRFGPDNPETLFLRTLRPEAAAAGVHMTGYRPHRDVMAAMARAAIVVVPSRWPEPFGLVAVEAMAAGAALLCSNRGGLAEVTGDAARPIDPDDMDGFASAICTVASDAGLRMRLAEAGIERSKLFTLDAVGPQLEAWRQGTLARFHTKVTAPI